MDLVLEGLREIVAGPHGVVTGPLTPGHAAAAARRPDVGAGTADVEIDLLQLVEDRLELIGGGAQKNDVTGGAVHVGDAGAVLLPDVTDLPQSFGVVEPAGRLVDAHGVKVRDVGVLLRKIGIAADHAAAVAHHTHDSTVLPVADLLLIGLLELAEKVLAHRARLRGHLDLCDEAGPLPLFKLVE